MADTTGFEDKGDNAVYAKVVTKSDGTDVDRHNGKWPVSFSMDADGAIKLTLVNGDTVVIPSGSLVAGVQHSLAFRRIWSTGTGSQNFVAYYK